MEDAVMPERIQLRRSKGWRMPSNTVKVDRNTKWGNPFRVKPGRPREYAITLFRHMLCGFISVSDDPTMEAQDAYREMAERDCGELRGKNLACWCRIGDPCHADILLELANK
jgi:Domain of unknown function (DUF4326)